MIRKTLPYYTLLAFLTFTACKKKDTPAPEDAGIDLNLTATEKQKVIADNSFSLKLFKTLTATNADSNLIISPLSVSFAMGMTNNGSNGQTFADITNAMNFSGFTQDVVNNYYNKLMMGLPKVDPTTNFKIANSIWYTQSFTPIPQFLQTNSTYYQAKIQSADFSSSATKDVINQWVYDQTDGKIPTIINKIPTSTIMYLINAIYFKSSWNTRFEPASTSKKTFYLANGGSVQTDFMLGKMECKEYKDGQVDIAEIPYHNKKYSMVILMPIGTNTVQSLAATIDSVKWQNYITNLQTITAHIILPKFKFSYNKSLINSLSTLGMARAFTDQADFTGINAGEHLKITDVQHKAYIDVNEDGTEAAAATSVSFGPTLSLAYYITIDHPFIFAIRENQTGLIIFTGVVSNPLLTSN